MVGFLDTKLPPRFWSKVKEDGSCWTWTGARDASGYGKFMSDNGRTCFAHKLAYTTLVGPIPEGKELARVVCGKPSCVNPAHMVPLTRGEIGNWARTRADLGMPAVKAIEGRWIEQARTQRLKANGICYRCSKVPVTSGICAACAAEKKINARRLRAKRKAVGLIRLVSEYSFRKAGSYERAT